MTTDDLKNDLHERFSDYRNKLDTLCTPDVFGILLDECESAHRLVIECIDAITEHRKLNEKLMEALEVFNKKK
jgi:hypothetical protein